MQIKPPQGRNLAQVRRIIRRRRMFWNEIVKAVKWVDEKVVKPVVQAAKGFVEDVGDGVGEAVTSLKKAAKITTNALSHWSGKALTVVVKTADQLNKEFVEAVSSLPSLASEIGEHISSAGEWIENSGDWILNETGKFVKKAGSSIQGALPHVLKEFEDLGKLIESGVNGVVKMAEREVAGIRKSLKDLARVIDKAMGGAFMKKLVEVICPIFAKSMEFLINAGLKATGWPGQIPACVATYISKGCGKIMAWAFDHQRRR